MTLEPKIGFLNLPPEIRNEIYEYLIEDIDTNVGPKMIRLRPRVDFPKTWSKRNPHRGDVYSLNQIIHRIRVDEFVLHKFVQDLLLVEDYFALKPKKIEIELPYPLGRRPMRLNMLPLLTLCVGNEDLHCTFLNKFGPIPELHNIFRDNPVAWGEAILDDLLEISLYTPRGTTTVIGLVFRDDCGREFIEEISDGCPETPPSSMKSYLKELGAQARVVFVVSKRTFKATRQGNKISRKAFEY
ncbi:hypothetical protein EJ07DRAFT_156800 [Lizonia empirigonia]|nr:hypothetical protein EJ07DRAFT_156800 [Lizonia empirigonia]